MLKERPTYTKRELHIHKETCDNIGATAPLLEQKRPTYTKRDINVERETYIYKKRAAYTQRNLRPYGRNSTFF